MTTHRPTPDLPLPQGDPPPEGALPVSETFTSIQGEGALAGVPSHFIRLSGCNLRCAWCDTPYASWTPESVSRSVPDLLRDARASGVRHVVLTGGEPLIFPLAAVLCRSLRDAGLHVTIETAGTVFLAAPCDLISISPKLSNSLPLPGDPRDPGGAWRARHDQRRLNPAAIQDLLDAAPARQLKFVVREPTDLAEIDALLAAIRGWRPDEVFLMPEGVVTPPRDRTDWIVAECLRRNWRFGPRLHIALFGNRRGT